MVSKALVILLVVAALVVSISAAKKKGKKKMSQLPNLCESDSELKSCRNACTKDKDCKDETNLNCAKRCKEACFVLEKEFGTRKRMCKTVLLRTIIYDRNPEKIPDE